MAAAPQTLELYSYWRSSSAYRIRIALAHKKIKYNYKAVNLLKGGNFSEEYLKINPMHKVPTLDVGGGHYLHQSMAILEYLEEVYPDAPLLPKDPLRRQLVREIAQIVVADTQPIQNLSVLKKLSDDQAVRSEWAKYWITESFKDIEAVLSKSAGKYCVGDEVTFADACLVPQVYNARRFQVDMAAFPIISRIDAALVELPAFKEAHPSAQPDAEKP